ncbi:hypothetical protein BGZ94_005846 [Podila epigama]|nr:hypothetical protein BGZ94_005846 [Podila epigama]
MRECRNQLSFAMASIEHQLDEYENMISYVYRPSSYPEIYPGPVQDADVPHMRSEVQYYVDPMNPYLPILPGYDICNIFGKGNCALAYPGPFQPTIFNEENNNNEGATSESNNSPDPDPDRDDVDLRRHFILALDELGPGRIVDSMVHLGAVSMFDMNSPTMISLVHQLSNLQMIREQQVQVIDGYQTPTPVPTGVYEQTVTFDVRPQLVQMTNGEALTVAQQLVVAWSAPPQVT